MTPQEREQSLLEWADCRAAAWFSFGMALGFFLGVLASITTEKL